MDSSDEYEYRETTVLGTGGEIAGAVVAILKPKRPGPLPRCRSSRGARADARKVSATAASP